MKNTISLNKNYEFIRAYKRGKFFVGKYVVLYILSNRYNVNRLGISISRKYGNSVKRNRLKRIIKEIYRQFEEDLKQGLDIVITARKSTEIPEFKDLKKEMHFLFRRLEIFHQEKEHC